MEPQNPQPPSSDSKPVPPSGAPPAPGQPLQPGQYPPGYPPPGYPPGYPYPPQGYAAYPPGYMPPPGYAYPPQQMPAPTGYMPQGYAPPPGYMPPPASGYMPQGYPGYQTGPMMPPPPGGFQPPPPTGLQAPGAPTVAKSAPVPVPQPSIPVPSGVTFPSPAIAVPAPTAIATAAPAPSGIAPMAVVLSPDAEDAETDAAAAVDPLDEDAGEVYHPPALTHIEAAKPQNAFVRAWKKIGGGSLTLSLAIHAGLIVVAGLIVFTVQQAQKQVDFLPGGGTAAGQQASNDMKHKVSQKKRTTLNKSLPMKRVVSTNSNAAISLPDAPPDMLDVPDVSSMMGGSIGSGGFGGGGAGGGFGKGVGLGGASGFVSLPPSMRSRCSASERLEKLRQTGGRPECEAAVTKSLAWFKTKQNPDGSWGRANKAAMTGFALLCYLGRCETPDSPFYGDNVMKGIMYLIELSKKNPHGIISENWEGGKGNAGAYEHGIATYALGEMYTLARLGSKSLPGMREAFEKGVEVIIKTQSPIGAWGYGGTDIVYNPKTGNDLSVVGWQYQALKAAKNTGLKIDGLHKCIDRTLDYMLTKQTKDGGFGNANRDQGYNQWSLSGCAILGLQTLGKGQKKKEIGRGIKFLREFLTAEPLDWNKNCNLYCWYYYTQAFFQAGGDDWKFYNEQFLPQILANQNPDGSFKAGRANMPAGNAADEILRQSFCTLQLEVYYRYLKVADRDEESIFDKN